MLREARRLAACGRDVAVGIAADHGRTDTAQLLDGLDAVAPRLVADARGVEAAELDVAAVLLRHPDVAVVDDYAHVNAPGSGNGRRWEDIEELLAAGTDVLTTLSVQHVASLRDAVAAITDQPGGETVPDAVVRRAEHIELVDISPELLRQRVADGKVFPKDAIDAALANEFRLGNLIALREIALIWLADRVDEGLATYRKSQGITATWPARERVVVGLDGGPDGELLIRRASRILSRVHGGDLLAVHVRRGDGSIAESGHSLDAQQRLVTDLGGTCHTVSGEDAAESLLEFARSVNATQIVIGASTGGLWSRVLGTGAGPKVVRDSGDIDVHIVSRPLGGVGLPKPATAALGRTRTTVGFVLAVLLPVLLTAALAASPDLNLATHALVHLTGVMAVAFIGGLWPAVLAAVLGSLLLNYFQTDPVGTFSISDPENVFALLVFLGAAVAVSLVVGLSARRAREAARARAEAATLADLARNALLADDTVAAFMDKVRETFQVRSAGLFTIDSDGSAAWELQAFSGAAPPPAPDAAALTDSVELADDRTALVLSGRTLTAGDRLLLSAHGAHLLLLRQRQALQRRLQSTTKLAEGNSVRTSILRAVSHDLRTPLAGIKLAVTALRRQGRRLPEEVQAEMLATIESYTERLDALISNLLDMSRISSGSAAPLTAPVTWRDAIEDALRGLPADRIRIDLAPAMPAIDADLGMLERVIANIVENALKYAPDSDVVIVGVSAGTRRTDDDGGRLFGELRIVDHGQGVPAAGAAAMFQPFQRLDDAPEGLGIGLGLAVAKGFTESMGGQLVAEPTPGGGLTMIIRLPLSVGSATPDRRRPAGSSTS